jgi:hypothetical protein
MSLALSATLARPSSVGSFSTLHSVSEEGRESLFFCRSRPSDPASCPLPRKPNSTGLMCL